MCLSLNVNPASLLTTGIIEEIICNGKTSMPCRLTAGRELLVLAQKGDDLQTQPERTLAEAVSVAQPGYCSCSHHLRVRGCDKTAG
jgi:hypothetical protein